MPALKSVLSPASGKALPSLALLFLLVYAVLSIVIGASLRQFETQSRLSVERIYAASTLDKELSSLMRDAHAMISAPSQLRMQAVLINLDEYEAGVDVMSALATPRSDLDAPLAALEQALPAIRSLTLQAARLDTDRSATAIQDQALAMTRLDTEMRAQIAEINETLANTPMISSAMADRLRVVSWLINILAVIAVLGLIYSAFKSARPPLNSAQMVE
ncbi:hypothetical protein [Oceanicaulis sp.]|uniref:hypothetical protein n=1 Tax=Oceanicaulis sp. TaxID=1924941 RepID=UPI00106087B7